MEHFSVDHDRDIEEKLVLSEVVEGLRDGRVVVIPLEPEALLRVCGPHPE